MHALAPVLAIVIALGLAFGIVAFARRRPGFSHRVHTISELGEIGAPDGARVSFGLFLPVALGLGALAGLLETSGAHAGALLAGAVGVGYLVAAFFRCDPGSPTSGSARQGVHNLGGAVEVLGGAAAILRVGEVASAPLVWKVAAGVVLAAAIGLSVSGAWRGAIQRVAEAVLFAALIAVSLGRL